jgi:TRAP-type C4-dicarboxylate transport system substrate-binding protein|tara:strand:+ start:117 stop:1100 length:984 start_codon:yes stop_codon:yes gene_type:complete
MKTTYLNRFAMLLVGAFCLATAPVKAAEVGLKAGFFIPPVKSLFRIAFDEFVADVNKRGKGEIQISQVVGPESVARGQWCNTVKNGVLDIAGIPPAYCSNLIPGIEAMDVAVVPPEVQRKNGATSTIQGLFSKRAGIHYLAQYGYGTKYHLLLRTPVQTMADFSKIRLRTTPAYTSFFKALSAQTVRTKRSEVFTAMERGVVDGFANPLSEVKPMGWHQVSKYVLYPGFYNPIILIAINSKKWSSLSEKQRNILSQSGMHLETKISANLARRDAAAGQKLLDGGLKKIVLPKDDSQRFLTAARDSRWQDVIKKAADYGPKLKQLLSK